MSSESSLPLETSQPPLRVHSLKANDNKKGMNKDEGLHLTTYAVFLNLYEPLHRKNVGKISQKLYTLKM